MLPTQIYTLTIPAGGSQALLVSGQYFKILSASGTVTVDGDFGRLDNLVTGQGLQKTPFGRLYMTNTSGSINTLRVLIGDENFVDGITGAIEISKNRPALASLTNTLQTVTNVSAQLVAARLQRQYLIVQNKDGAGTVFINFGAAATLGNGMRIPPGGNFETGFVCTEQAIFAIGDTASNANVLIVEG